MAKSERKSKWKRKFRALKREKNQKKEMLIMNTILANESPGYVQIPKRKNQIEVDTEENAVEQLNSEAMTLDDNKNSYSSKTKLNAFGNYPPWMNQRSIKKLKKRLKPSGNVAKMDKKKSKNKK